MEEVVDFEVEARKIAVVVDDPIREDERRLELLPGGVCAVLLPFAGRKSFERFRIARPSPQTRSRKAQFGWCVDSDEDEARHLSERFNLGWIPDRIDGVPSS